MAVSVEGPDFPETPMLAADAPRSLVFTFDGGRIVPAESRHSRDAGFETAAG